MTEYRFAAPQEMPRVIDFIDLVFSQVRVPHDFASLIPKVYGDGHEEYGPIHAIALEDGEIRGCVAVLPFDMTVAGQTLHAGYLGSVSVHHRSRGAGHMKKLMQMQIDKARADGLDMITLGGQRQRYAYFGFSPAGGCYRYNVTATNIRHALKDVDASGFTFEPLEAGAGSDYAYQLYQRQPVCGSRSAERFAVIARSFNAQGWIIQNGGANAGYLIASNDHAGISELVLEDPALIPAVIKAWLAAHALRSVNLSAAPHNKTLNRLLAPFAEGYSITRDGYTLCLNYANTIRCWMALQNSVKPLTDGVLRLCIDNAETLRIAVQKGAVSVETTTEEADLHLTAPEADQLLFGFNRFDAPEVGCAIPGDWFPLPLNIPSADTF